MLRRLRSMLLRKTANSDDEFTLTYFVGAGAPRISGVRVVRQG
jgi:hypothetical protein